MIIKSTRVATDASKKKLLDHLFRGAENERVEILRGGELDILDCWRDAQSHSTAKALRQWIFSPYETTTRDQVYVFVDRMALEFGFDPEHATIVEHEKKRVVTEALDVHWHVVVGEVDPVSGRVLSSSHDHARHEFIARLLEAQFGHRFVLGAHHLSVIGRLRREGHGDLADRLDAAFPSPKRPRSAFTTPEHQAGKRKGFDLAELREIAKLAWNSASSIGALKDIWAQHGLDFNEGSVPGEWIIAHDGKFIGSFRRLLKITKKSFKLGMEKFNDGTRDGSERGGDDPHGNPGGEIGGLDPSGVRGDPREDGRAGGQLHDDGEPSVGIIGVRNGGDAGEPEGTPRADQGAGGFQNAAASDPRRLIEQIGTCKDAIDAIIPRAEALAAAATETVEAVLGSVLADETAALAVSAPVPPRAVLDALTADEEAMRKKVEAISAEVAKINAQIGELLAAQVARRKSLWRRWLPDAGTDSTITDLRARRAVLEARFARDQKPHLRAVAEQAKAQRSFKQEVADAKARRDIARTAFEFERSIVVRARRMISAWPSIAYAGSEMLLRLARRIEGARRQGWSNVKIDNDKPSLR